MLAGDRPGWILLESAIAPAVILGLVLVCELFGEAIVRFFSKRYIKQEAGWV